MTQASASSSVSPTASPQALHVVLFGMPAAGKTSLLGALSQAAQTQEHLLNGRLVDLSRGLSDLQNQLYEGRGRPTTEEVVPYPVHFEPSPGTDSSPAAAPIDALLLDCDGRVANDLLSRPQWADDDPETGLAAEVLAADALVLLIDASAAAGQVEADFTEFGRFLDLLEKQRGRRSEVGGLPVFLVLTKCDLLARPGDTAPTWMERIEERKHEVQKSFTDFLARQAVDSPAFGHLDLHVWATAVKRPALANAAEKSREPYGVAELFRQCFDSARTFRRRQEWASRRLRWTVAGAGAMVMVLAVLILAAASGVMGGRPHPLQAQLPTRETRAAVRLAGPMERLQRLEGNLASLMGDPLFGSLPKSDREHVQGLAKEVELYTRYWTTLRQLGLPEDQTTEKGLDELEKSLRELTVPGEYQSEWIETEAVRDHDQRVDDVAALRSALDNKNDARSPLGWYLHLRQAGRDLEIPPADVAPEAWSSWNDKVAALLAHAETPPFQPTAKLPGSKDLTNETVLHFQKVVLAKRDWEDRTKPRLERLRDLSAALGLPATAKQAPLDVQRLPAFSVADARGRRLRLEELYPNYPERLTLTGLPEESTIGIRNAARTRFGHLIEAAQPLVLDRLQRAGTGDEETVGRWRKLLSWLADPQDLSDWRVLAQVLANLQEPEAADPIAALAAFLKRDLFDLDLTQVILDVPDTVRIRPAGKLEIFHPPSNERGPALVFVPSGEGRHDDARRVTVYPFQAQQPKQITYRPGDVLRAELAVKDAENRDLVLSWVAGRSAVYQFEHLIREPLLHRANQAYNADDLARGVALHFAAGHGVPALPEMMPAVRLKR